MEKWYAKDPDLIGRVTRIVRVKLRRKARRWERDGVNHQFCIGFEVGVRWALAEAREEYRRQERQTFNIDNRHVVSFGRTDIKPELRRSA